jgi:acetyl-CoA carboxylase biotin carboxyl carrier protein
MNMGLQSLDIRQLAEWLAATDIDFLELQGPDVQVRIHREGAPAATAAPLPQPSQAVRAAGLGVLLDHIPGRNTPLVSPGMDIHAGDLVALLQVGPLLLPVRADCDGQVGAWLAVAGQHRRLGHPTAQHRIVIRNCAWTSTSTQTSAKASAPGAWATTKPC